MPIEILMPALSPTMTEGSLAKWLVGAGDTVTAGDVIAEIETDKAIMEVEAVDEGKIGALLVTAGTEGIAVNTPIAMLMIDGDTDGDITSAVSAVSAVSVGIEVKEDAFVPPVSSRESGTVIPLSSRTPPVIKSMHDDIIGDGWPDGTKTVEMTVREALRKALIDEMRRDEDVFLMGEEVAEYQGAYKISEGLLQEFGPRRVIDVPITEAGFTGLGIGAALAGLKPVIEFMTFNFSMQAIDQIINSASKSLYMSGGQMGCSIVFRGPNGPAAQVGAQHSQDYSAWYSHIPGLKVIHPYTAADASGLLKSAIRDPNPVIFLENEILYGRSFMVPELDDWIVPIGKARIARSGTDVTLVSWGMGMSYAMKAALILVAEGIDVEVIDMRTLRPMDTDTIVRSVMKTGRIVCVEEGWPQNSVSSEVCTMVVEKAFDYLDAPPVRVTSKDVFMPYAANLEKLVRPTVDDVIMAVKSVSYR